MLRFRPSRVPFYGILASLVLTSRMVLAQCGPPVPLSSDSTSQDEFTSRSRLWIAVPAAVALGTLAGVSGYTLGGDQLICPGNGNICSRDSEYWIGASTGLIIGSTVGAYFGGLRQDSRGRFLPTLAGATLGASPLLLDKLLGNDDDSSSPSAMTWVSFVTAPVAAALANHMFRAPRGSRIAAQTNSLLELHQLGLSSVRGRLVAIAGFRF